MGGYHVLKVWADGRAVCEVWVDRWAEEWVDGGMGRRSVMYGWIGGQRER